MTDYENELRRLLPLVVDFIREGKDEFHPGEYRGHSRYKLVGNILAAFPPNENSTPWTSWRAYDATDFRLLYASELPEIAWDAEAVRVLIDHHFQQRRLQGEIETIFGRFHVSDAMLFLDHEGKRSAWNIMEPNFATELTLDEIAEQREYFAEMAREDEEDLLREGDNANERRIDAYFGGEEPTDR